MSQHRSALKLKMRQRRRRSVGAPTAKANQSSKRYKLMSFPDTCVEHWSPILLMECSSCTSRVKWLSAQEPTCHLSYRSRQYAAARANTVCSMFKLALLCVELPVHKNAMLGLILTNDSQTNGSSVVNIVKPCGQNQRPQVELVKTHKASDIRNTGVWGYSESILRYGWPIWV